MNKTYKIIFSLILAVLAIFSINISSNAASYKIGQKVYIDYQKYMNNSNMYCLEHHDSLRSSGMTYKVVRKVTIKGKEAEDDKGRKVTNIHNARLAYIVGAKEEDIPMMVEHLSKRGGIGGFVRVLDKEAEDIFRLAVR